MTYYHSVKFHKITQQQYYSALVYNGLDVRNISIFVCYHFEFNGTITSSIMNHRQHSSSLKGIKVISMNFVGLLIMLVLDITYKPNIRYLEKLSC